MRASTIVVALGLLVAAGCADGDGATGAIVATPTASTAEPTAPPGIEPPATDPPDVEPADIATGGDDETAIDGTGERDFTAIRPIMQAFVDENDLNGAGLVVVDADNGIVAEEYVGEVSADRVSLVASSSKMVTAGVLMRLHDDGLLDIDAPVADAVEWGSGNPTVTPAQLVSNSSGLVGLGPNPSYEPYVCQFLPDREVEECGAIVFETPDDDADIVPPDTEFRYGGAQWQVAGALAETVTGKTWAELIDEIYIQPCGLTTMGYNNHWFASGGFEYPSDFDPAALVPTENPHMEGGLYISPVDYADLLLMHLRDGMCDSGQVLPAESVDRMHDDRVLDAYGDAGQANPGYGMGWWVDRDTGIISDAGAYGSVPWLDVDAGYGVYLVLEASSGLGGQLSQELIPVVADIMQ